MAADCFNPCCIGLAIAAGCWRWATGPRWTFQSLLYWISHCGFAAFPVVAYQLTFQSLLYWISHCGPPSSRKRCTWWTRFQSLLYWISHCGLQGYDGIAQHLEFQSLLYWISHCGGGNAGDADLTNLFQSLLYWISHCGVGNVHTLYLDGIGFNPCCIGLAIAARSRTRSSRPPTWFQSLLYWISHCGPCNSSPATVLNRFQSLLYWISHCGGPWR